MGWPKRKPYDMFLVRERLVISTLNSSFTVVSSLSGYFIPPIFTDFSEFVRLSFSALRHAATSEQETLTNLSSLNFKSLNRSLESPYCT